MYVFKVYFPYYIIVLSGLCIAGIIQFEAHLLANYYFCSVFFTALLIWYNELKSEPKKNTKDFATEPNQTHLP